MRDIFAGYCWFFRHCASFGAMMMKIKVKWNTHSRGYGYRVARARGSGSGSAEAQAGDTVLRHFLFVAEGSVHQLLC